MSQEGRWELPPSWQWARAIEFATVVGGGTPENAKSPDNYTVDGIPWITPADLSGYKDTHISRGARDLSEKGFASCSARLMPKGTVLLSSRAPVGYCVVASNEISSNQGFKSFVLHNDRISPEFLRYYLIGSKQYLESEASGTTFLELSGGRAEQLLFPIAPAGEQQRIVSKLDELFSRIDEGERALERVQKLVERYRQSVLKAAVTGELTRDWREKNKDKLESGEALLARILKARRGAWEAAELDKMKAKGITPANDKWKHRYEEPAGPDTSGLPDLPTGWVWSSGAQLFEWASGDFLPAKAMQLGDVPVYGGNGVNGQHSQANVDFATIVVGRVGVHCGNVHLSEPKCWVTDNAIYATRLPAPASLEFLLICLRSAQLGKTSQGGAQPFVNQKALNEVAIPIPPLDEQITIVDLLAMESSRLDGALATVWAESRRTAALRQAVLKSAFSGLLVSQQPDDEPAAALLERIAANRSQTPAKPRRGITRESGKA